MVTHWMVETDTWKSRASVSSATATIVVSRIAMIDPSISGSTRRISGVRTQSGWCCGAWTPLGILHNTQRSRYVKESVPD